MLPRISIQLGSPRRGKSEEGCQRNAISGTFSQMLLLHGSAQRRPESGVQPSVPAWHRPQAGKVSMPAIVDGSNEILRLSATLPPLPSSPSGPICCWCIASLLPGGALDEWMEVGEERTPVPLPSSSLDHLPVGSVEPQNGYQHGVVCSESKEEAINPNYQAKQGHAIGSQ